MFQMSNVQRYILKLIEEKNGAECFSCRVFSCLIFGIDTLLLY